MKVKAKAFKIVEFECHFEVLDELWKANNMDIENIRKSIYREELNSCLVIENEREVVAIDNVDIVEYN